MTSNISQCNARCNRCAKMRWQYCKSDRERGEGARAAKLHEIGKWADVKSPRVAWMKRQRQRQQQPSGSVEKRISF